jgi:Na+-translocating ferredoxin:NAD+ oxidoreductase RnfD subunit
MGVLAVLWLPPAMPWWTYALAIMIALSVARAFDGRVGRSPLHPAMIGCAVALVFAPATQTTPVGEAASMWVASAYLIAGVALAVVRCVRWQTPLVVFISGAAISFGWQAMALEPPASDALFATMPVLALTEFFVATDPSSSCVSPRARWVQAAGIGVLVKLALLVLHDGTRVFLGMAGAVLLMNAAAPWLDRLFERQRAPRTGSANP